LPGGPQGSQQQQGLQVGCGQQPFWVSRLLAGVLVAKSEAGGVLLGAGFSFAGPESKLPFVRRKNVMSVRVGISDRLQL
jgi:hypothetical protein